MNRYYSLFFTLHLYIITFKPILTLAASHPPPIRPGDRHITQISNYLDVYIFNQRRKKVEREREGEREKIQLREREREKEKERERPRFFDDSGHKHAHGIFMNKFSV